MSLRRNNYEHRGNWIDAIIIQLKFLKKSNGITFQNFNPNTLTIGEFYTPPSSMEMLSTRKINRALEK